MTWLDLAAMLLGAVAGGGGGFAISAWIVRRQPKALDYVQRRAVEEAGREELHRTALLEELERLRLEDQIDDNGGTADADHAH